MLGVCLTLPSSANSDVLYSTTPDRAVFYEGLLVIDAEKIYSSYYGRDIYRVTLYDEQNTDMTYLTIAPDSHAYGWIFYVYANYFQVQYDATPNWINGGNTIILPYVRTNTVTRQNFTPLVHKISKKRHKKRFKTFRNTKSHARKFKRRHRRR